MKVLIIDNFDSFTYNLYQAAGEYLQDKGGGFRLDVIRNNGITGRQINARGYDRIIISPGPGSPADPKYFGVCGEVLLKNARFAPTLGVCLGLQGIAHFYGGRVIKAKHQMHGKTSLVKHSGKDLFSGVPQGISVMRYHSLIVDPKSIPSCLKVTAQTVNRPYEIMGLSHKSFPITGVQFHPESFATEYGKKIIHNFLCQ